MSAIVLGFSPTAQAISFVPAEEGEVNVGFAAALTGEAYLNLDPVFASIESLVDPSTQTRSRLFVDRAGTSNTYGGIRFRSNDVGTAEGSGDFWFRPVAMAANGVDPLVENGQLEVGLFKFNFASILDDLEISWFDTEFERANQGKGTSYTVEYADGSTESQYIAAGRNNNIQSTILNDVASITLNLGERRGSTGDGVNFQMEGSPAEDVPEPSLLLGLGALLLVGLGQRRTTRTHPTD
jgi:hypothetical protein